MNELIAMIEQQGWGWSLERRRSAGEFTAYVHMEPELGGPTCKQGTGLTPEHAMTHALTKAMAQKLATLGIDLASAT
jgi:hypothetical protein